MHGAPRFRPSPTLGAELLSVLPPERVSQGAADRLVYSRDMWPRTLLSVRDNSPAVSPPDFVVWPETTDEVAAVVRVARAHRVPLVPFGGGSGVCGGAMAVSGGVIVDLKRMAALVAVSSEDGLATFQPGIIGQTLEDQLNLRGLTLGHFPASIYCSTLGGWLAARSAGQMSSKYGKIEDMVLGLEAVLGDGRIVRASSTQQPDLIPLLVGSEGTLAIITEATLRVHRLPSYRIFHAYEFPRVERGCEAFRRALQRGLRPAVMRLYDEVDTLLARASGQGREAKRPPVWDALARLGSGHETLLADTKQLLYGAALARAGLLSRIAERLLPRLSGGCLAIVGFEGTPELVDAEAEEVHRQFLGLDARDLGEGPGIAWYQHRYAVSYKQSPLYTAGGFADTMEVASTWDRLLPLYSGVREALAGLALVLAHFSQAYP
jgi:alkyldihydroxyacetonephosphate synthase